MNTKQKIISLIIGVVLSALGVTTPAQSQIYTYPGWGCMCYGPGINLDECRGNFGGAGIVVQGLNPSTNNRCGPEGGGEYPSSAFGISFLDCCIQHDFDWSTCDMDRGQADIRLGSCVQQKGDGLRWQPVIFGAFNVISKLVELAVSAGPGADQAYRTSIEQNCMCSPCGLTGADCWFEAPEWVNGQRVNYPREPREQRPNIPPWFPWPGGGEQQGFKLSEERTVLVRALVTDVDVSFVLLKAGMCNTRFWPVDDEVSVEVVSEVKDV